MASRIPIAIGKQHYELIQFKILEILTTEFVEQKALQPNDSDLQNITIASDIFVPVDESNMPLVNILLEENDWETKSYDGDQGSKVTYMFEIYCSSKFKTMPGTPNILRGDTLSAGQVKRIAGVIRAILISPEYKCLGLEEDPTQAPFIETTYVKKLKVGRKRNHDSDNVTLGLLVFEVMMIENSYRKPPAELNELATRVTLDDSLLGYRFTNTF